METARELLKQYKLNEYAISKQNETLDEIKEKKNDEKQESYVFFQDKISDFEKQMREERNKYDKEIETEEEKTKAIISELEKPIFQVKKIIYFLQRLQESKNYEFFDSEQIKNYRDRHLELLETYKDDLVKICIFLAENDRPKNKFTLIALGESLIGSYDSQSLGNKILELPYSYGSHLQDTPRTSIILDINHFPTIQEAKEFYKTKGYEKLLSKFFKDYKNARREYETTILRYDLKDFRSLVEKKAIDYWGYHNSTNTHSYYVEKLGLTTNNLDKMTKEDREKMIQELGRFS